MIDKSEFFLFLKDKKIGIPSTFACFDDVNPSIHESLIKTKKYEVKSEVREEVLLSFIEHWTTLKVPDIQPNNISEYTLLSNEFDRMKDLVQLYQKRNKNLSLQLYKNQSFKKTLDQKDFKYHNIKSNYQEILIKLLRQNGLDIVLNNNIQKQQLQSACIENNCKFVSILSRRQVEDNGIIYLLNEEEKTADIFKFKILSKNEEEEEDINFYIPRSITYNSQEYVISRILKNSIKNSSFGDFIFASDSEIKQIEGNANFNVRSFTVPSCIDFSKGFPVKLDGDAKLTINPNKIENIKFYEDDEKTQFVIGKTDTKSDIFNVLCFLNQETINVTIPSFIEKIAPGSMLTARNLQTVTFLADSKLRAIDKYSICLGYISEIVIPQHVTCICEKAFSFSCVQTIKFAPNSELKKIEKNAFSNSLKFLSLPSSVSILEDEWCNSTGCLNEIIIIPCKTINIALNEDKCLLRKTDTKSDTFDDLIFACRNIKKATIPSFVKRISSFAFSECENLNEIVFLDDSQLNYIGRFAFSQTKLKQISLPKHVYQIDGDAFHRCGFLERIDLPDDSELFSIGNNIIYELIEHFHIPSKVSEIKKKWLKSSTSKIDISLDPRNENFVTYDNKFILGKSRIDSKVFDVLIHVKPGLKEVTIPSFIKVISSYCFNKSNVLNNIHFPPNSQIQIIEKYAFAETSIASISIPDSITKIEKASFDFCSKLEKVGISQKSKLTFIGEHAFNYTSLESIYIPSSVKEIGLYAFYNNNMMKIIDITENPNFFMIIYAFIYDNPVIIMVSNNGEKKIDLSRYEEFTPLAYTIGKYLDF